MSTGRPAPSLTKSARDSGSRPCTRSMTLLAMRCAVYGSTTAHSPAWHGESAWRPLPRREYTVRSHYHTLVGTNRLTILPTGWVHSQDNVKTVLASPKVVDNNNPALAREFGLNRYERIADFDFSAAETYWTKTSAFWSEVRDSWAKHLAVSETVQVATMCGEERVYKKLFALAADISDEKGPSGKKLSKKIDSIMNCAVSPKRMP